MAQTSELRQARRSQATQLSIKKGAITAPYARTTRNAAHVFNSFIVASLPVALLGIWNVGEHLAVTPAADELYFAGWRSALLEVSGQEIGTAPRMLIGALFFLPLLTVAAALALFWETVFAHVRKREIGPSWLMTAWLFVLLLPAGVPPTIAALGLSFGVVVGHHIFGGAGRYLVSPALLGVLFVHIGYPGAIQNGLPHYGSTVAAVWACVAGVCYLVYLGAASWRTVAAGVIACAIAAILANQLTAQESNSMAPWYAQLAAGNFAFMLAFIATDPSISPLTRAGRWLYGGAIGLLTIAIRTMDPSHPEGSLYAVLLAALSIPLLDHLALRRYSTTRPRIPHE